MGKIAEILKEIFPSTEMAAYLARCPFGDDIECHRHYIFDDAPPEKLPLHRHDMAEIIAGAPISLERKRELFLLLAEDEDTPYFSNLADILLQAIQEMQPRPGEFFYLICYSYDKEIGRSKEDALGAFLSWEHIFAEIEGEMYGDIEDLDELTWFLVEKWTPDGNGRLNCNCGYTVIGGEVRFCSCEKIPVHERMLLYLPGEVNLPVPFHAGDIVTIDCRPLAPVRHVVILEIGDNCDCCCLQALHREGSGTWDIGAVKHNQVFPFSSHYMGYSPLYRLASFHGQLPEEERFLEMVSRYINGDEARGRALKRHINRLATEDQIIEYIESNKGDFSV